MQRGSGWGWGWRWRWGAGGREREEGVGGVRGEWGEWDEWEWELLLRKPNTGWASANGQTQHRQSPPAPVPYLPAVAAAAAADYGGAVWPAGARRSDSQQL
jgi:hypothetical protein